jgi:phosphoenolpyruvate carboxylase
LVDANLKEIGDSLRSELITTETTILSLTNEKFLLAANPVVLRAVKTRIPFLYPLHLLQVDFLNQLRTNLANDEQFINPVLSEILMITIQGIAAGMQNTG